MLRVNEIEIGHADADHTVAGHAVARLRACGLVAALIAGTLLGMSAWAEPPAHAAAAAPAAQSPKAAKSVAQPAKKRIVSPYARAAKAHQHDGQASAGQASVGHAPTMVQAMGKPHKPHGAPSK